MVVGGDQSFEHLGGGLEQDLAFGVADFGDIFAAVPRGFEGRAARPATR